MGVSPPTLDPAAKDGQALSQTVTGDGTGGTQAVDRAAALVTYVVEADHPVGFAEAVGELGLARSTTSRLLSALERTGLLGRSADGEYVGGPLFVLYAARHDRFAQLARLARPTLESVAEATGESVHLAVANGGRVEYLDHVDSTFVLGSRDWADVEVPLHTSALGLVLLAWDALDLPAGPLERPTPTSLGSRAAVSGVLAQTRARGFATTWDDFEIGLGGLAAPVFALESSRYGPRSEGVVATVGISGPTARLERRVDQLGRLLIDQTEALSERLRRRPSRTSAERTTA